jgi:hypothetical protein
MDLLIPKKKPEFRFLDWRWPRARLIGEWQDCGDHVVAAGREATLVIDLAGTAMPALVIGNHDWSGIVRVAIDNETIAIVDLYSWYSWIRVISCEKGGGQELVLSVIGKNGMSRGEQAIFYGFLVPREGERRNG